MNSILGLLLALVIAPQDSALKGARTPAFATDGRMAVSIDGDLYVQQSAGGKWMPLTKGAAWDRDPVWSTDGKSIIYSSNRAGVFSLWRIPVAITGTEPERLTNARDDDSAPSLAPDGSVAFVRGSAAAPGSGPARLMAARHDSPHASRPRSRPRTRPTVRASRTCSSSRRADA